MNLTKKYIISGPPDYLIPAHLSYARHLLNNLRAHGERTALIHAETGSSCSYRTLVQKAVDLATGLKSKGVHKGDIIAVCSENRTELAVTIIAVIFTGAAVATASPFYTEYELKHVLGLSKPKFVFCSQKVADNHANTFKNMSFLQQVFVFEDSAGVVRNASNFARLFIHADVSTFEPVDVNGKTDLMAVLSTSGTTGLPKGAMHTHLTCLIATTDTCEKFKSPDLQSVITFTPWHHAFGLMTTLDMLNAGKTTVYITRYQEEFFYKTIRNYTINLVLAVPAILVTMSKSKLLDKYKMTSIKHIYSGAGALNADTIRDLKERIPTLSEITQGYGMTENMCVIKAHNSNEPSGSVGKPVPGVKVKVVSIKSGEPLGPGEEGEICIKSHICMKGYIGDLKATKDAFDEDGFYKTGDVGYYTDEGFFYVVDRVKDLIKYKGNHVPPAEVEAVLLQNPGVQECAVIGAPDEIAEELPTAFVVRSQWSKVTEKELQDLVARQLSDPKKLRGGVRFVKELPRNPTGKLLRRVMREKYFKKPVSKL